MVARNRIVETAPARPRDMGEHAIQRDPAFFVRVESLIKKSRRKRPFCEMPSPYTRAAGTSVSGACLA